MGIWYGQPSLRAGFVQAATVARMHRTFIVFHVLELLLHVLNCLVVGVPCMTDVLAALILLMLSRHYDFERERSWLSSPLDEAHEVTRPWCIFFTTIERCGVFFL